ncbi:pyridoxal-5-phosphate-dependent protein subunit beta [bacterium]|nr:pyridoxal-5-phosphate-dependent protein subunit beta [bacterium]
MIDLTVYPLQLERTIKRCQERGIIIPTFEQMIDPERIPAEIRAKLHHVGLWDVHPINLFRITWKNEPVVKGGGYGRVNFIELPSSLTGVKARILGLVGKWFPTGAHKVGATFGCLVPRLITGQFDPTSQKAVWPSTGNYCRGGAYVAALLACESIAILPEEMSRERFDWLARVAGEVIATPGCESNVKEIFDKCWELRRQRQDVVIFNQFDEMGNHLWHYVVTGRAIHEVFLQEMKTDDQLAGLVLSSGSAGTLGSADYLKGPFPVMKVGVGEALQCPTLLLNGFGGHRLEGIGDKHVPWIHNVRNTDMVIAIDDNQALRLLRLFNEPTGRRYLLKQHVPESIVNALDVLGISSLGNLISAIKMAKYYEFDEHDLIFTVFTDSMELYGSRLAELRQSWGAYSEIQAARDFEVLQQIESDHLLECSYYDRKRIHNLKYYTWIEQQQKELAELNQQWFEHRTYWADIHASFEQIDALITDFNKRTKLLA